jgi:hypothetical protein
MALADCIVDLARERGSARVLRSALGRGRRPHGMGCSQRGRPLTGQISPQRPRSGRHARVMLPDSSHRAQFHDGEVCSALHGAADELGVGGPAGHSPQMAAGERVVRPKLAAAALSRWDATERSLARRQPTPPLRAPDARRGSSAFRERRHLLASV